MCNQFAFHHQFGIDTGRSKFEQQTDSILSVCGSHGQKTIRILVTIDFEAPRHAQFAFHHQFGIDTGRSKFEQQTDSILSVCGSHGQKTIRILVTIDFEAPRHAQYMHKAWKKHQNTVYWVDINLALKKELKFYQTRSNAIILHETLPAYCIPKVGRMETGEVVYEKVYASPRPPPMISLKHDWMKELRSEVARRPEGQVAQQSKSSQLNQPNPNPDHDDRTGTPVVCRDAKSRARSRAINAERGER